MPARSKTKSLQLRRGKRISKGPGRSRFVPIVVVFAALVSVIFLAFRGGTWAANSNLNLVIAGNEDTYVTVFDTKNGAITTIIIPGDTQVDAASNLGELKLKNVWQLAKNEGKSGQLVADTVAKNFKFPVNAWAGEGAAGFIEGGILPPVKALFGTYPSSLTLSDKFKLLRMGISVREFKRVEIPLETTGFITNKKLSDGARGYVVARKIPDRLRVIFADEFVSARATTVQINDGTKDDTSAVAQILEVYGAKVASVNEIKNADYDCKIASKNTDLAKRIARLFGCEEVKSTEETFDVQMWLGTDFARRF